MIWTELHAKLLSKAFENVLGEPDKGAIAFVRCLAPEVVEALAGDATFAPASWQVFRVADVTDLAKRTITADRAVELRETKKDAVLLLVDRHKAGAGMDGVYSAAREIQESVLFNEATRLAGSAITQQRKRPMRDYAEQAIRKARTGGYRVAISRWAEFDFLVRVAHEKQHPGALLYLVGLWPVAQGAPADDKGSLDTSRLFVERLLGVAARGLTPSQRIEALKLVDPLPEQQTDLERFLWVAAKKPLLEALAELAHQPHLWVNALKIHSASRTIQAIELVPWRKADGALVKWSGLVKADDPNDPPKLVLTPNAASTGNYSKLEVRWKTQPAELDKGAVQYHVSVMTDLDGELASRDIVHTGGKEQKCRFTNDDFSLLGDDVLVSAQVRVSVVGNDTVEPQKTEEFIICFGEPQEAVAGAAGKKVRTFSEGIIELASRNDVVDKVSSADGRQTDAKNFVVWRIPGRKTLRVFYPPLVQEVERDWHKRPATIGRWRVKVRTTGERAGPVEFVELSPSAASREELSELWERAADASQRMAKYIAEHGGGVAQVYAEDAPDFGDVVKKYLLAWAALLEHDTVDPAVALAHTVEVQSLSGRTIGLIVLPTHPLRVAWQVAYDNLVLHARFSDKASTENIRQELKVLDGAMFPGFLPGLETGQSFVFADTLGFHAAAMVADTDKEPKAAVAILARVLSGGESSDAAPTVGEQSAEVLSREIRKYLECHPATRLLYIHALRAGDGLTVARALGNVYRSYAEANSQESGEEDEQQLSCEPPAFVLELYPSQEQRAVAGRFLVETRQKRRTGAGAVAAEDLWLSESIDLRGGILLPRLRWARKEREDPQTPAHLAIAFDTFASRVEGEGESSLPPKPSARPFYAFGLISFLEREYSEAPSPRWRGKVLRASEGEKHPSERSHTERLVRLQEALHKCTARNLPAPAARPVLVTEIPPEKAESLHTLHRLCDWVVTVDRNAGIEYFDSPRDNREVYDAYVIDCVPEREDLGCLQLITSTANLEEVQGLVEGALDQMGLIHSRRNAEFLMENLKALSGRLAIRLTGQKGLTAELVALALCHAYCRAAPETTECWLSLSAGFFIPVADVRDLLPPLMPKRKKDEDKAQTDDDAQSRPELIYVSLGPRRVLTFSFVEVRYRRHLRTARSPELVKEILCRITNLRDRWDGWYADAANAAIFSAVRRAELARVLRFYADKARRHADDESGVGLSAEKHREFLAEIDRMIARGAEYSFVPPRHGDRGWIFCPEYTSAEPMEISPPHGEAKIYLFGPAALSDGIPISRSPSALSREGPSAQGAPEDKSAEPGQALTGCVPADDSVSTAAGANHCHVSHEATLPRPVASTPNITLGSDVLTGEDVYWRPTIQGNPHLLLAGLPGMGKTTCLVNLCTQMLYEGICPIIFSYHQDIDHRLSQAVNTIRFVDYEGLGFNPLSVTDRTSRKAYLDVAGALRDILLAIFPDLGELQGEAIRRAIKDSFIELGWDDPTKNLLDLKEPQFRRFVDILHSQPNPDRGLKTLLARLDELSDYGFFELRERPQSLWETAQPIVIRIHTTQNEHLQQAFASLVFYGLYKDMLRRGIQDRITHAIVFDEAHRAARLKLIPTMAKECRKYGISLILASQEAKDFHTSVFSAIANYLVLRLTETDARALVRNVARSDHQRVLVDRIKQMERFKALYFSETRGKPAIVALSEFTSPPA